MTYGDIDAFSSGAVNAFRSIQDTFNFCKGTVIGFVHACGETEGQVRENHEIIQRAVELGKRLGT